MSYPTEIPLAQIRHVIEHLRGTGNHSVQCLVEDGYDCLGYLLRLTIGADPNHKHTTQAMLTDEVAASDLEALASGAKGGPFGPMLVAFLLKLLERLLSRS